jgi:hypothetical protein
VGRGALSVGEVTANPPPGSGALAYVTSFYSMSSALLSSYPHRRPSHSATSWSVAYSYMNTPNTRIPGVVDDASDTRRTSFPVRFLNLKGF